MLDAGEDLNSNNHVEAGNIASINSAATTDETGTVLFDIIYPKMYGQWLDVRLEGKTTVQGTEFAESLTFVLPVLAEDVSPVDNAARCRCRLMTRVSPAARQSSVITTSAR